MADKGQFVPFMLEGVGSYEDDPRVLNIQAPTQNTVRVYFDQEIRHVNPANLDDAMRPGNYLLATGDGVPRTVVSVSLIAAYPTIVDLNLDGEMTNSKSYTCTVSNVRNIVGLLLNPGYASRNFSGVGVAPQVQSAAALTGASIQVIFNEPMLDTAALRAATSYHLSGPTSISVNWVTVVSATEVRLAITGEMHTGGVYTLSVGFPPNTGIQDIAWNDLDGILHTASFTGIGVPPQVLTDAIPKGSQLVWVKFNEAVDTFTAQQSTNYVIMGGSPPAPLAVTAAIKLDDVTVELHTDVQTSARLYTITVSGVQDLAGNAVQPPNDHAAFLGVGYSPPDISFAPIDGATGVGVRTKLLTHFVDRSTEFTGVNRSTIWVRVQYTEGGVVQTKYPVYAGELQLGFTGEVAGNPLTLDGISFYVLPFGGWPENKEVTVYAFAEDLEGSSNSVQATFQTGLATCFEDNLPTITEIETKLLSSLAPFENAEKLRRLLFECCSRSYIPQSRARTMMFLAAVTDMRTFLAGGFDFSQVDDVLLCERQSMLSIYQTLQPYLKYAKSAVDELAHFSQEGRELLRKYLSSNSPVYVVNAVALAVVLTAIWEV